MSKLINIEEFKGIITSAKKIAVAGFRWSGTPQLLLRSIRESFNITGKPNGLTVIFTSSPTDPGIDHLAHPELLSCSYGSYYGSIPKIRDLVEKNLIEGYSLPQGQISLLFREIARGSPGLISKVGMDTYVDPLLGGGKLNKKTKKNCVQRIRLNKHNYLFYSSIDIDVALLRGTTADSNGNISMESEPIKTEFLSMAQAVRSCGGKVFVQVKSKSKKPLNPNKVDLPSHLVDYFILAEDVEKDHRETNKYVENKAFISRIEEESSINKNKDPDYKHIIAKKALSYINPKSNIILGQGIPELVGVQARKNYPKYKNLVTFMESGVIGGIPERRPDFGVAFGPDAFLTQDFQFAGFNGGHADMAILSFVEFDKNGNINISQLGEDYFGCGGYIDICFSSKTIIFVGSFKAKKLEVLEKNQVIQIKNQGEIKKAVNSVKEITFSPKMHNSRGDELIIVTERCVFKIINGKIVLKEVYPGVNFKTDILDQMEFIPQVDNSLLKILDEEA